MYHYGDIVTLNSCNLVWRALKMLVQIGELALVYYLTFVNAFKSDSIFYLLYYCSILSSSLFLYCISLKVSFTGAFTLTCRHQSQFCTLYMYIHIHIHVDTLALVAQEDQSIYIVETKFFTKRSCQEENLIISLKAAKLCANNTDVRAMHTNNIHIRTSASFPCH